MLFMIVNHKSWSFQLKTRNKNRIKKGIKKGKSKVIIENIYMQQKYGLIVYGEIVVTLGFVFISCLLLLLNLELEIRH